MNEEMYRAETIVERRKSPRLPLKLKVHFELLSPNDNKGYREVSQSENIGAGGVALQSEKPLHKDQELKIIIHIPSAERRQEEGSGVLEFPEAICRAITIRARVAWCAPCGHRYILGIQFLEIEPKDQEEFRMFLQDYELDEPDSIM